MKLFQPQRVAVFLLLVSPTVPLLIADTPTSTQTPQGINLNSQTCGIDLSLPDYLVRNNDDDQDKTSQYYENWDLDHIPSPGDNDLKVVTITGTAGAIAGTMTLEITKGSDKINGIFWKDGEKNEEQYELSWPVPPYTSRSETLFIEGYKNSDSVKDVEIKATMYCPPGQGSDGNFYAGAGPVEITKQTTVYELDMDVDSYNNNELKFADFDDSEDKIEASKKPHVDGSPKPGKYLWVNAGFNPDNNDGTPGWADGFKSNSNDTEDDVAANFNFTPLQVTLKKPFDPKKAKIRFSYSASDPNGVQATATPNGGTPDHPYTYVLGEGGALRIWKKDCPGFRDKNTVANNGDYIPLGGTSQPAFDWKLISSGDVALLYIEAVRPFTISGALNITAFVSQEGVECSDTLQVTSVYFKEENNFTIIPSGDGYEFIDSVLDNNVQGKTLSPKQNGSQPRNTVRYESIGNLVPADVDKLLYPMNEIKIGMIQNLVSSGRLKSQFSQPTRVSWDVSYTAPSIVVPAEYRTTITIQENPATRANDNGPNSSAPLFTSVGELSIIGVTSRTLDVVQLSSPKERSIQVPSTGIGKVFVKYTLSKMSLDDHFVAWFCAQSDTTKQFYPMSQKRWNIKADSSDLSNTGLALVENPGSLIVPVRSPIANDNYLDNFKVDGAYGEDIATIDNPHN